jgi:hypothetical protein
LAILPLSQQKDTCEKSFKLNQIEPWNSVKDSFNSIEKDREHKWNKVMLVLE